MGYLMDAWLVACDEKKTAVAIPFIKRELKRFKDLPWCSGVWEFSEDLKMPWDQLRIQLHINAFANHILYQSMNSSPE